MAHAKKRSSPQAHKVTLGELAEAEMTPEQRMELFEGDRHLEDWFEAEKMIDNMFLKAGTKQAQRV